MALNAESFGEYMKSPLFFPQEFKDWISDWFALNVPKLHVSQIYGFKLQSMKAAAGIASAQVLTSTSYVAFDVDGPTFDHVPNGYYLLFFGATFGTTASQPIYNAPSGYPAYMAPVYDGSTPSDGEAALMNAGTNGRVVLLNLTAADDNHTITFHYKRDASLTSGAYQLWNRWAFLLKVVTDDSL